MPNIIRRSPRTPTTTARPFDLWRTSLGIDPFRMMREMMQLSPFDSESALAMPEFRPTFEMKETDDGFYVTGDVPGVRDEDIEITTEGNTLTVRGSRSDEDRQETDEYHLYERSYGSFARSFQLPDAADLEHVRAEMNDGVLRIAVPRREDLKRRRVQIARRDKENSQ